MTLTFKYKNNVVQQCSTFRSSKLIKNKQTNVYEVEECLHLAQSNQHLPRRVGHTNLDVYIYIYMMYVCIYIYIYIYTPNCNTVVIQNSVKKKARRKKPNKN